MPLEFGHIYRNKTNAFNINLYSKPDDFTDDRDRMNHWVGVVTKGHMFMPVAKVVFHNYIAWKLIGEDILGWWHVYGPDDNHSAIVEEVFPDNDETR